jgi:hypothetical protein
VGPTCLRIGAAGETWAGRRRTRDGGQWHRCRDRGPSHAIKSLLSTGKLAVLCFAVLVPAAVQYPLALLASASRCWTRTQGLGVYVCVSRAASWQWHEQMPDAGASHDCNQESSYVQCVWRFLRTRLSSVPQHTCFDPQSIELWIMVNPSLLVFDPILCSSG